MTQALWKQAVKTAKLKAGINPDTFMKIDSKMFKEAQQIYLFLLIKNNSKKSK